MNLQKLFYTAAECFTLDERPCLRDTVAEGFESGDIAFKKFIPFCDRHLILPTIYKKLRDHGLTCSFPPKLVGHLDNVYKANNKRNNEILQQVDEICSVLSRKGIAPVFLKGAGHLLDGLYSESGERLVSDIDFLVRKDCYNDTIHLLKDAGYDLWWRFCDAPAWERHGPPDHLHYVPLIRGDLRVAVEIHHIPVARRYAGKFSNDMVFNRKKQISARGNCFVPCDEHQLVHNFIHGQLTNSLHWYKTVSLRDVYDLYLLSKKVEPEKVLAHMEQSEKASGYFLFSAHLLGLGNEFYATENKKAQRHCKLCVLALKYPRIGESYRKVLNLGRLIFKAYLGRLVKAVYQKSYRDHIVNRIKDPRWFRAHAAILKRKFWK